MTNARVYIADDHSIFRGAVVGIVREMNFAGTIMEAHSGRELLNMVRDEVPDLIILDLDMPQMTGFQVLDKIFGNYPEIRIIALAMNDQYEDVARAIQSGAHAVVPKGSEPAELKEAIASIINQREYENAIMRKAARTSPLYLNLSLSTFKTGELSAREVTIVELVCKEYTNKQIGYELSLSEHTIRNHKVRIMRKMGVKNTPGLVKRAFQFGLILHQ